MPKFSSFFHDRKIAVYYALFLAGAMVVVYQAQEWKTIGDSVDLICLLFFIGGFTVRNRIHLIENTMLMTAGYILPLFIRNALKLSYIEAPSKMAFIELGLKSFTVTLALGFAFTAVGFLLKYFFMKFYQRSRSSLTTRSTLDKD